MKTKYINIQIHKYVNTQVHNRTDTHNALYKQIHL